MCAYLLLPIISKYIDAITFFLQEGGNESSNILLSGLWWFIFLVNCEESIDQGVISLVGS